MQRLRQARRLSEAYENDAIQLMAVRENLTHLLPIRRGTPEGTLSRLVHWLKTSAAGHPLDNGVTSLLADDCVTK